MTKKLYVGNLPFGTVEDDIHDLFGPFGDIVSVAMINDRETGRFRGFCFVEMADSDAESAMEALEGKDFNGRALRINEARPKEERPRSGGGGYNRGSGGGYNQGGSGGGYNKGGGYDQGGGGYDQDKRGGRDW